MKFTKTKQGTYILDFTEQSIMEVKEIILGRTKMNNSLPKKRNSGNEKMDFFSCIDFFNEES